MNRRAFVAAAGGAAILSPAWTRAARACDALAARGAADADLVLLNGKVITVDARDSIAQAVAVTAGRITAVGSTEEIRTHVGAATKVMDLGGKCMTPGLVDSHLHLLMYGQQFRPWMLDVRWPKSRTKAELLTLVAERAKTTPKGEWIVGNQGFQFNLAMSPSLAELDAVAPDHPLYLKEKSGQFSIVNSRAMRIAGITRRTRDPYNAKLGRDASGEPNGQLFHYPAEQMVQRMIPRYFLYTPDDMREAQRRVLEAGYTSIQDVLVGQQDEEDAYRRAQRDRQLQTRLYLMRYLADESFLPDLLAHRERYRDEWLTFGGWKLAIDGGGAAGTTLMYDQTLEISSRSYPLFEQKVFNRIVLALHRTGLQISIHAGGDRAVDMCLDAYEAALQAEPRADHRHRIEHAMFVTPQALERIKKLGIVISTQPQWISLYGTAMHQGASDKAMERFFPLRTMMNMGIPVAFGCDLPATIVAEPRYAFMGAMYRTVRNGYLPAPAERISIRDALRMHTMGSAYASFDEKIKGSIEPGKLADFVVWSHDLYAMTPMQLGTLAAVTTIVGGNVVFG